jgi:hypothetical protein
MTLTEADLAEIRRQMTRTQLRLAKRYGVSPEVVDAIARGRSWRRLVESQPDLFGIIAARFVD